MLGNLVWAQTQLQNFCPAAEISLCLSFMKSLQEHVCAFTPQQQMLAWKGGDKDNSFPQAAFKEILVPHKARGK